MDHCQVSMLQQHNKLAGFQRCVNIRSLLFSDNRLQLFTGVYCANFSPVSFMLCMSALVRGSVS